MIKHDHQLLTVWHQASTFSQGVCIQKGKSIWDVLFQYQAIQKHQIQKNNFHSFQMTVLPSISPPEEDIVLRFKNVVPIASSLVSRSLPRANVNCCLLCYASKFTYMWILALTSHTWSAWQIHTWTETESRQKQKSVWIFDEPKVKANTFKFIPHTFTVRFVSWFHSGLAFFSMILVQTWYRHHKI